MPISIDLDIFFNPGTVAVIGISTSNAHHPANVIFSKNLLRYPVEIFPVNPKGGYLVGQPVYSSLKNIPTKIDLAIIAVRANLVCQIIDQCIDAGVKGAIVISGGFSESGNLDLQQNLIDKITSARFTVIGPNCLGVFRPGHIDTFFLPSERVVQPHSGDVAIISQSGGILVDLLVKFADEGVGISSSISIGNKIMVREVQLLNYFANDPTTKVIAVYIEGFGPGEGRDFALAAQKCPKPVIVMKAGKTPTGRQAVSSHTASLAGDYDIFRSVLTQHNVLIAKNEFELVNFCKALCCYQQNKVQRLGIISGSGGHGVMAVDSSVLNGLTVPRFSQTLQKTILDILSDSVKPIASVANPIDLTGSAIEHDFEATIGALSSSDEIDCILLLLLPYPPGISADIGARISMIYRREGKPLVAYVPHVERYRMLIEGFELNKVPVSSSIEGAVLMAKAIGLFNHA